jgi:hypothetical protein
MNRHVATDAMQRLVLYPGRLYRMLVVVTGRTFAEDLEDALVTAGFAREDLASTSPGDWESERPRDWPHEPTVDICANECLVRVTGRYAHTGPAAFSRDMAIADDATYTIVDAWQYGPSLGERAGAAPAGAPSTGGPPAPASAHRGTVMLIGAAGLIGFGLFQHWRAEKRVDDETRKLRQLSERAERDELAARVAELMREGMRRDEAIAVATRETEPPNDGVTVFATEPV